MGSEVKVYSRILLFSINTPIEVYRGMWTKINVAVDLVDSSNKIAVTA